MKIQIKSFVQNGNLNQNRTLIKNAIESFEGKDIIITFDKPKKKRSNPQNSYLWSVLYPITQNAIKNEWGEVWNIEKVHDFYKIQFNVIEKVNEETGQVIKLPKSTTENTTTQQEEYHLQIREFLKEWFNVVAPLPNENLILEL
jgi:hypothetical protein